MGLHLWRNFIFPHSKIRENPRQSVVNTPIDADLKLREFRRLFEVKKIN